MIKPIVVGASLGALLLLAFDAVAVRLGAAPGVIPKAAGSSLWVTTRAAGLTAFLALTADVVFGLLISTGAAYRWIPRPVTVDVHRWLSTVALSTTALHALALLGDRYVRFDLLDLLIPFLAAYRRFAVGLGVLAGYAALLVHASFWWRGRIGGKTWRRLHFLSFFVFVAALLHGILAGTDSSAPWLQALYGSSAILVAVLGGYRVLRRRHTHRPPRPEPSSVVG